VFRVLAVVSLLAQVTGLLSLAFFVYDLATLPHELIEQAAGDTTLIQQFILETVLSYRSWIGAGVVGAIVAWLLILKEGCRASWFLATSRVLAWSWMPLAPVGTILGVLVLSARSAAIADASHEED